MPLYSRSAIYVGIRDSHLLVLDRDRLHCRSFLFFFNDTATTEIYTLSLHDALPIFVPYRGDTAVLGICEPDDPQCGRRRSEEHTSELQSRFDLVCRLLLEKKNSRGLQFSSKLTTRTALSFAVACVLSRIDVFLDLL